MLTLVDGRATSSRTTSAWFSIATMCISENLRSQFLSPWPVSVPRTRVPATRGADGLLGAGHQQEAHDVEVAAAHGGLQRRLAVCCVLKLVHARALLERTEFVEFDATLQVR
jgi:hypothetical protein